MLHQLPTRVIRTPAEVLRKDPGPLVPPLLRAHWGHQTWHIGAGIKGLEVGEGAGRPTGHWIMDESFCGLLQWREAAALASGGQRRSQAQMCGLLRCQQGWGLMVSLRFDDWHAL